jgi:hypothetical protein
MSTTISRLRAVVDASSVDEGARKMRDFGQTVSQTSASSSQALGRVSSVLRGDFTGALMGLGAAAGVVTAGVAIGKVALSMDDLRQKAANVRRELTAYAGGAGEASAATEAMLRATDGGISRMDAMASASKLLGMGLATTSQQVYDLSRMAVMLGDKTMSVTDRMGSFNAMLANQSIERLDTFGISSGRVRARIEELQAAMPGLSREQAFVNATLEIGAEKLKAVEAEGVQAASSLDKVNSALSNLRQAAAEKIHVEIVVDRVAEGIDNAAYWMSDSGEAERRYAEAFENYRAAAMKVAQAQEELGKWYANLTPLARENYETKLKEAEAAAEVALRNYELAITLLQIADGTYNAEQYADDYADRLAVLRGEVTDTNAALQGMNRTLSASTGWYGTASARMYAEAMRGDTQRAAGGKGPADSWYKSANAQAYAEAMRGDTQRDAGKEYQDQLIEANNQIASHARDTIGDALQDAAQEFEGKLKSALQEGQRYSIGLSDLRPGGDKGPNAPGANGAFEDIYRLQAFLKDGSWGETVAKYGLDRNTATQRIQDFQSGKWNAGVMELINKDQLNKQIQDAQLGQAMMDAVAADLAKANGADPKIVKAMLGMNAGSDGAPAKLDFGGQLVPSLASAIDAELLSKGEDLKKRGAATWDKLEEGMIDRASKSTKYTLMIEAMVDNALANYIPPA